MTRLVARLTTVVATVAGAGALALAAPAVACADETTGSDTSTSDVLGWD